MTLMTHARMHLVDYRELPTATQEEFDHWLRKADTAGTNDAYRQAMTEAALTSGIPVPRSRNVARCSCLYDAGGCGCGAIFDANADGVVVTAVNDPDHNLSQRQCPTCGHDHGRPIAD